MTDQHPPDNAAKATPPTPSGTRMLTRSELASLRQEMKHSEALARALLSGSADKQEPPKAT